MSAALSGGQEITSAFSRSLYYATPWIHPLSHTRERKDTYTCTRARSSNARLTSSRVRVRSVRAGRPENEATSHTHTRGYLSSPSPRRCPAHVCISGARDMCVYTRGVCTARYGRDTSGLTIMRLVANGTDTRIPADVTTCKMAAHDATDADADGRAASVASREIGACVGAKRH